MQKIVSVKNLGDLDNGVVGLMIDKTIDMAVADLEDRGREDGKPREVVIKLRFGVFEGMIVAAVDCEAKLPAYRSKTQSAKLKTEAGKHKLLFDDMCRDNPDQPEFEGMKDEGDARE
jgi:hypothetical protein